MSYTTSCTRECSGAGHVVVEYVGPTLGQLDFERSVLYYNIWSEELSLVEKKISGKSRRNAEKFESRQPVLLPS
ncbi:hypothetical protein J6590_020805 [Homalodisca vitripennis]|nr:hypothetical protein J6590_020805 [Homalodisca vitripennis]